jgi:hypothetical protein
VVNLWWIDGESVVFGWWVFGFEKMSLFENFSVDYSDGMMVFVASM